MLIRDPIHGDIELTDRERQVLDTPEMQRLRGIKQLGAAYLVYPGCLHTRFEHSLGTLAAARRILQALSAGGHHVSPADEELVCIAALVHDVSHIPFGHTFEDERQVFPRHDTPGRFRAFLRAGELSDTLDRLGLLAAIERLLVPPSNAPPDWRSEIVAGAIDADLLDYLRRDSYFAGLSQDYDNRVFHYFTRSQGRLAVLLARRGIDRPDARSEVVHLLRMRYFLTERVYLHHAKVIAGAMISKALERAAAYGVAENDLFPLSDQGLFDFLKAQPFPDRPDPGIVALVRGVEERRLLKRAYVVSASSLAPAARGALIETYHVRTDRRQAAEKELAATLGLPAHAVIISCPKAAAFREAAVLACTKDGIRPLNRPPDPAEGADIPALERQYENLWRFQVFGPAEARGQLGRRAAEMFGYANELTA